MNAASTRWVLALVAADVAASIAIALAWLALDLPVGAIVIIAVVSWFATFFAFRRREAGS